MAGGRRDWLALAVLVLPVLLLSVDMTVLGFALPYLSEDLGPTAAEQLWIVDIYSFVLGGLLVLMGTLGDRIGRRRLLLSGAVAFGAASALAAFAAGPGLLIAARALLGVGGATLMPSTLGLIRTIFTDPGRRRTAIAVWGAGFSGGMALGPVLGGWLLEHFWWGSVFLINVPVMLVLLVVGPILLPEARDPRPGRFDPVSALLSLAAILPVVYGIKRFAQQGPDALGALGVVAGVLLGVVFVRRQRALEDPMLDLRLFRDRRFSASLLTNMLGVFSLVGLLVLLPQHLQLVLGRSPVVAALWLLPTTAAGILGAFAAARLARHVPVRWLVGGGLLAAAAGFGVLVATGLDTGPGVLVAALTLVGFGVSVSETLTNDLIVTAAPVERAGAASAISETGFELGGALGTAVLGSIAAAVYRSGLPAGAGEAARETLGGAVATAAALPPAQADTLLSAAKTAFVHGLQVSAVAGAVLLTYTAVQAMVLLRRPAAGAEPAPERRPAGVPR
ncbi:MFS transporter [Amycolatopsis granulosa]|uniref:MFS transporter n=1 Tax=Amycolatopsis granulosa TaxID=185684 RepID=UPI00142048E5|nr:MFS transporter [Amycolatopsis granulosa]